ncbi:LysM peptidoglycan-binding domain-containing protein [Cellvibrio sp. KY-GH-1]|uniref:LysM peptidoglycan-binding domain-containing protein n=1 Tax=Cellvibrio sp. KY-GH-1 TaxID=2303332 RepID=UPI00124736CF|nr:LysM peptidoglycan-binding domain-containing protein [Cellvibrio sp. KY-GH-1]QEY17738.1 LysM peptidoglycan-binding domain-containing protein [Cellvibrio sp. KY-GH-1]
MKKILLAFVAASLLSLFTWADDSVLKQGHPDEYTVKKGDTLWDISATFLNSPWLWPEIWHVNPQIENPHLIFPGDLIKLIYLDGQPRLTVERTLKMVPGAAGAGINGATKLSPSIRVQKTDEAITAIPLDKIDAFLSRSRIVEAGVLEAAPYMLAGQQQHVIVGAGDQAYARGSFDSSISNYGIYRKGQVFKDPITRELLGVYAQGIGTVAVDNVDGEVASVDVIRTYEEVRPGDQLLPSEDRAVESMFYPSAPDDDINAQIIAVEGGVTQVGKFNVVIINRGEREGLQIGNVLAIYKTGEVVRDRVKGGRVALPDERAGLLIVFRTFEKLSFGLVLEADRALAVNDKVKNP